MAPHRLIQSLGVFSSGGDSQGMNAAVRAVVRTALNAGIDIYAIYEGYEGMIRGGDYIRKLGWNDVGGILHQGGTVIGSARSAAFRTFEGRLEAAFNLITRDIDALVCIGGDGSLSGANEFRQEWPQLLRRSQQSWCLRSIRPCRYPEARCRRRFRLQPLAFPLARRSPIWRPLH